MVTIGEISTFLGHEARSLRPCGASAGEVAIRAPLPITEAGPGDVSFCGATAKDPNRLLATTHASLIIVDGAVELDLAAMASGGVEAVIRTENARLDFIRVIDRFFAPPQPAGRHPSAVIDPSAHIAADAYIGPAATVGADVEVGAGTVIHAGVHVYRGARIGRNVIIHSGSVIGADGFGYERDGNGEFVKFPHVGGVVVEDDVEIGANTCIDRGTLGDTRVCQGAKIDNLVHVAHNVQIGRHAAVIAHAMVAGSTRIGDYA